MAVKPIALKDQKKIGQRFQVARNKTGHTQESLGKILGVSKQSVFTWEAGTVPPPMQAVIELARLSNLSLDWILTGVSGDESSDTAEPETKMEGEDLRELDLADFWRLADETVKAMPEDVQEIIRDEIIDGCQLLLKLLKKRRAARDRATPAASAAGGF